MKVITTLPKCFICSATKEEKQNISEIKILMDWKEVRFQDVFMCADHTQDEINKALRSLEVRYISHNPEKYLKRIGTPRRYWPCSFDSFEKGEQYVNACREYLKDVSGKAEESLFLTGSYGSGKTHLAVSIARELLLNQRRFQMKFITATNLLLAIREAFNGGYSERDLIDQFVEQDFLFLDDLGAEKLTDWAKQTFYLIIDGRYSNEKSTIVTSNFNLAQIADSIDGRIASRIHDGKTMKIKLPDYRKRKDTNNAE